MKPNRCGFPAIVAAPLLLFLCSSTGLAETVTYTMQTGTLATTFTSGTSGWYNAGDETLGFYAKESGLKQAAAWMNFKTNGNNTGASRSLQVGDQFVITVSSTRAFGEIGFSLNADGVQGSSYANRLSGSRLSVDTTNNAAWRAVSGSGNSSLAYVPLQDIYKDYRFTVKVTSETTADAFLTVDGTDYRAFNLVLSGTGGTNINGFSLFGRDMWDGSSNDDGFFKQTTQVSDTGTVELGYYQTGASTFTPGLIKDGLAANSTTTARANSVFIGGDSGSTVVLSQSNSYSGATTVNAGATARITNANGFGTTAGGVTVTTGGRIQLDGGVAIGAEALALSGTGISSSGVLQNLSGTNSWAGAVSLQSSSRINSTLGTLTLSGSIAGGANVLFVGGASSVKIDGVLSGAGFTQDGTTTSLFKDGGGTLTLSGANDFSGDTRINFGSLVVASGGTLGNGSDIFISANGSLSVNTNVTVASLREWGSGNGGTVAVGSGATLTINGADKGNLFQNSISGAGGVTMSGSGTTSLALYNAQSYTGTTTVTNGKITSGATMATSAIVVGGGEFEATADNVLSNSTSLSISDGDLDLQGNDTVASLTSTGGDISLGSGKILTVTSNSSIGVGSSITGGTLKATSGTLTFNSTSGNTSAITIESGATLNGTGTLGGATTINGTHNAGNNGIGQQTISSSLSYGETSIFEWEIDVIDVDSEVHDSVVANSLSGSSVELKILLAGGDSFTHEFWNTARNWTAAALFGANNAAVNLANLFSDSATATNFGANSTEGLFSFTGAGSSTLTWTPVPEPSSALAGLLVAAGMIRRRR